MGETCIKTDVIPLFKAYEEKFKIGAALNHFAFLHDNFESRIVKNHFNLITAENATKMDNIFLSENNLNFSIADRFIEFGKNNQKSVHWHSMICHRQNPKWIFQKDERGFISKELLNRRLEKYVKTVADHTKDTVSSYDVANQIFSDNAERQILRDGKEGSLWHEILGDDYIKNAFFWAHEANPHADLILTESFLVENQKKRMNAFNFIKGLLKDGTPVSAVGIQLHISMENPPVDEIKETMELFGKLGLKVVVSSLDVSTSGMKLPENVVLEKQAQRYHELFECFKSEAEKGILQSVTFWGVTDKTSWKNSGPFQNMEDSPLLFDKSGIAKPAFYRIAGQ